MSETFSNSNFDKWKNLLWLTKQGRPTVYCPKHKCRLDIVDEDGGFQSQETTIGDHDCLMCPIDGQKFDIDGDSFWTMQRRYLAVKESESLKGASYRDLDNIYTPVLRVEPKPKDKRYSIQVEIDETPQGKKLVIYAMDRADATNKTQIFIDPEKDKLSFDGNDLHPNMIFSKVEAFFKDSKKAKIEKDI